jgi:N-acetylneuraminic acid mutarotase
MGARWLRRIAVLLCGVLLGFGIGFGFLGSGLSARSRTAHAAAFTRVLEGATRWRRLRSATLARCEVAGARIGRFIYVVGGFTRPEASDPLPTTGVLERYDIRHDRWQRMAPLPVPVNHAVAVAFRGSLYVHGGWPVFLEYNATANFWRFDPRRNRWTRMPSSPTPRGAEAGAVIGDKLYVAGGADNSGSLRSLEIYDFTRRRWSEGPSFSGPARNHTRGVASGGYLYVLGGRKGGQALADPSTPLSYADVDRYDPRHHRWKRLRPMPQPRSGFGAVALTDGRIAVFGGEPWPNNLPGAHIIGTAYLFNPRTERWRQLPNMRTPVHAPGAAALGNRIYAIEGSTQPQAKGPTRIVEALNINPT